ncbi:SDR family NAD(P)-dependent oxidoreductase [Legionella worsleiensis]|uniref:Sepiapterin reductase n=1 Tax=Legionella worsleiensis TaxID=45076 RepID=A0A0W1ALK2_9GAMM|nr:SDR family NAD(P)-dependent oxidoreductase [Legionella worsleiensis]KTD82128.1 sepiapterin reductase [Legionella worsleiensis]STY31412.1 yueD sepiapterin reductase [Legionella worsleiensis]
MFIITGGGSGLGKALALNLAQRGKSVLIIGRREAMLKETAAVCASIKYLCADVSTSEGRDLIRVCLDNIPQIHALVNNAGSLQPVVPITDIKMNDWHQTLATNLDAPLCLPQLLNDKLKHGRVLNIGSGAAYFPVKGWTTYCVSKAALAMLTRCWQLESDAISFASVMPGIIDTEMQAIARNGSHMDPEHVLFYQRLKQHNRLISPDTVAEFLAWLLLDLDADKYVSKEWDIYDTSHHAFWLKPPHQVLHWDF